MQDGKIQNSSLFYREVDDIIENNLTAEDPPPFQFPIEVSDRLIYR